MTVGWLFKLDAWAKYAGISTNVRASSDEVRRIVKAEHLELLQRRVTFAIWFGVFAYLLDFGELWFNVRNPKALAIQLSSELTLIGLAVLTLTSWGQRHKFGVFHVGYALVLV